MAKSTDFTAGKGSLSLEQHLAFPDTPAVWDFLYGGVGEPRVTLSFESDPLAWQQLKAKAAAEGTDPTDMLRFALYFFLDGSSSPASARQRLMAHREWERTRPILFIDQKGARWVPADLLGAKPSR